MGVKTLLQYLSSAPEGVPEEIEKHPSWANLFILFILFLVTLGVYYPSLHGDFVNIDDQDYVPDNEYIRDLSLRGIYQMFSSVIVANYFPLQILSYALDYTIWGLNPFGYRLTNLLLHMGNGLMVYFFFRRLLRGGIWLPFVGSLIFILHPVNVESVAWISERKNLLSTFFLLLSFLTYIRYLEGAAKPTAYAASLIFFLFSVLAKVSAVILPLLLILYDLCWTSRPRKEWIKDKIPFLGISAFFSWLAVHIYQMQKIIPDFHGGHPVFTFLTMANVVVEYLLSLFFPVGLYFYYETPIMKSFGEVPLFLSLALLAILGVLSFRWYRGNRPVFFCWLWFLIPLLPVLNIVPISILRADRYLYLPSMGFAFLLIWWIPTIFRLSGKTLRWIEVGVFCLIVGGLAFFTERQSRIWQSTYDLWFHTLQHTSAQANAYLGLGNVYRDRGQTELAVLYYKEAVQRNPRDPAALTSLGDLYLRFGRAEEARDLFQRALVIDPNFVDAQVNIGIAHSRMGEEPLAIAAFEKAMKVKKGRAKASNNLGAIYRKQGNLPKAIACFQEAVKTEPTLMLAQINLAMALRDHGRPEQAIVQLKRALQIQPRSFHANYNLGRLYLEKGIPQRAAGYLSEAMKSRPEDPDVHFFLAIAYELLPGEKEKARFHYQEALEKEKDLGAKADKRKKWQDLERRLESEKNLSRNQEKGGHS